MDEVSSYVASVRPDLEGLTREQRIEVLWGDRWGVDMIVEPKDCDVVDLNDNR